MPSFDECGLSPLCWGKGALAEGIENVIDNVATAVASFCQWSLSSMAQVITEFQPIDSAATDNMTWLQSNLTFMTAVLAFISIAIAAIAAMWHQRGQPLKELLASLLRLIIVSAASVNGILLLAQATDEWSAWIIESVPIGNFTDNMVTSMVSMQGFGGPFVMIILGIIGALAGLIQVAMMFVRTPLLILMAGIYPMAAAATNTEWGKGWFQKVTGWIVAFLAFKPAVAIIFALGQRMVGSSGGTAMDNLREFLMGMILIVLSIFAVPALVKMIVPSMASLGSGGGAALGAAAGAAGMALASGARSVAAGGGSAAESSVAASSDAGGEASASGASNVASSADSSAAGGGESTVAGGASSGGKHAAGASQESSDKASTATGSGEGQSANGATPNSAGTGGAAGDVTNGASSAGVSSTTASMGGAAGSLAGGAAGGVGVALQAGQKVVEGGKGVAEGATGEES